ncbi:uncharacterized protein N7477_002661 [Penicillium maclennaniae]|uniref:uncharacterized protein n=1 Tax=Penicillium maclennaniae TaxID=1343394 RepID=UPI0025419B18|nr:uncharacterized protein N7477_002661 [Penicillium maclennaniae]KAJ5677028.1 hypothetical protein N7477_002661 [Penicillium maclennaniae]
MADAAYYRDLLSPQDYYASLNGDRGSAWSLKDKFHDIDDKIHFKPYMKRLSDPLTKNFVLDFGNEDAFCATDLDRDEFQLLLRKPVRGTPVYYLRELTSTPASEMFWHQMDVRRQSAGQACRCR